MTEICDRLFDKLTLYLFLNLRDLILECCHIQSVEIDCSCRTDMKSFHFHLCHVGVNYPVLYGPSYITPRPDTQQCSISPSFVLIHQIANNDCVILFNWYSASYNSRTLRDMQMLTYFSMDQSGVGILKNIPAG